MQIEIAYGDSPMFIRIPERNLIAVLTPSDCCAFHDTDAALKRAAQECAAFVGESQRVLVLVNDYTRPTPNAPVLAALEPVLSGRDFKALVCLGTHREPTEAEYAKVFGTEFLNSSHVNRQSTIVCHDSRDKSRLFFVGKTSFGTDVWLNRELLWADKIITINSIEPHYFAGYTGGRKGFLPGIAGYETTAANHNMVTRPGSTTFGLEGNPVHEDMTEAAKMVPRPVFSIQLVQDRNHNLLSIHSGDVFRSFDAATRDAHKVFALPVKERADIVMSVLRPPYDINFYQAQRAVEFSRPVLKNPSVHITVSACRDGIGNDSFIKVFQGCKSASDLLSESRQSSIANRQSLLGWHKSARLAQIMHTADLCTVMGVDDDVVKSVFMHPYKTAQDALDAAFARLGQNARAYIIPDAGSVVPVLS
jgi:nickel-dependent lactate racemase